LDRDDLMRGREILSAAIQETVDTAVHSKALSVLGRRLTLDLAWQTEAYQRLQASRQDVLLRIMRLAWKTDSYTHSIGSVVQILGQHDEVAGCSAGRIARGCSASSQSRAGRLKRISPRWSTPLKDRS
jgi:hypothetical protein